MSHSFQRFFHTLRSKKEQYGFFLLTLLCASVIVGTALWTRHPQSLSVSPTPPVGQEISAAQLLQESLANAVTATPYPLPSSTPQPFATPLREMRLLTPFNDTVMQRSEVTGIWALHDAADYACMEGETVFAIADGTVIGCAEDGLWGAYVEIDHGDGLKVRYAGMTMLYAIRIGDPVRRGQTIGFGGNGMLAEGNMASHVHIRITQDGQPIDPETLWGK